MRADSVLQWLGTISGAPPEQLSCLVDSLLWELAADGFEIVDRERLMRVFAPTVGASVSNLKDQIDQYQVLTSQEYGVASKFAFGDPLDAPSAERALLIQRATEAVEQRDQARIDQLAALDRAKITEKELGELARLRAKQAERRKRATRNKRKIASRPGKKRKRR